MQLTYRIQQSIKKPKEVKNNWILSINKTMKTLSSMFEEIFGLLRSNKRKSQQIAKEIQRKLSQNHFLESKKNKLCFPEIISLFTCVSEK
jgi:predicted metal-dependent RNase